MYCTGGVRCEAASAYLRRKGGDALGGVYQLNGGIERYLEAHEGGGYFRGKNHVFDKRRSVGPPAAEVVGRCFVCSAPTDDYSSQSRCCHCRLLLLVCDGCCQSMPPQALACHDCAQQRAAAVAATTHVVTPEAPPTAPTTVPPDAAAPEEAVQAVATTPLRILCLHGFRQSGSAFRSRCSQLQRKLGDVARLVFVDAPHLLSAAGAAVAEAEEDGRGAVGDAAVAPAAAAAAESVTATGDAVDEALESATLTTAALEGAAAGRARGRSRRMARKQKERARAAGATDGGECARGTAFGTALGTAHAHSQPRYSWLRDPTEHRAVANEASRSKDGGEGEDGGGAPDRADSEQLGARGDEGGVPGDDGWASTLSYLRSVLEQHGPFDGVLGFSQGAAAAAP
eukprot:4131711-Prymnesium_polylepis.1